MKQPLSFGFALTLCATLAAQTIPATKTTITTATPGGFAVLAMNSTPSSQSSGIADKTTLSTNQLLRASTKTSYGSTAVGSNYSWYSGSGAYLSDYASATNFDGKLGGDAGSAIGDSTSAKYGPHSVLVAFELPKDEKATLTAYFSGSISTGATSKGEVDVGNNGQDVWKPAATSMWSSHQKKSFEVTGGESPLVVKLTTECKASQSDSAKGGARAGAGLTIFLTRAKKTIKCTATAYGAYATGCPETKLAASSGTSGSSRWIRLDLTNAAKDAVGFFVIGAKKLSPAVALPAGGCNLHTDVLALIPLRTSSTGTSTQWLRGSSALTGAVTCQDVIIELSASGLKITTSNGLEVSCKLE